MRCTVIHVRDRTDTEGIGCAWSTSDRVQDQLKCGDELPNEHGALVCTGKYCCTKTKKQKKCNKWASMKCSGKGRCQHADLRHGGRRRGGGDPYCCNFGCSTDSESNERKNKDRKCRETTARAVAEIAMPPGNYTFQASHIT